MLSAHSQHYSNSNKNSASRSDDEDDDDGADLVWPPPSSSQTLNKSNTEKKGMATGSTSVSSSQAGLTIPAYLSHDWNPDDKTINELISALSERGVELPGRREKKQFYVDLFDKHIAPYRSKIVQELQRIQAKATTPRIKKRSSAGVPAANTSPPKYVSSPAGATSLLKGAAPFVINDEEEEDDPYVDSVTTSFSSQAKAKPSGDARLSQASTYSQRTFGNDDDFEDDPPLRATSRKSMSSSQQQQQSYQSQNAPPSFSAFGPSSSDYTFNSQDTSKIPQQQHDSPRMTNKRVSAAASAKVSNTPSKPAGGSAAPTPSKFVNFAKLATPVKDLPDFSKSMKLPPTYSANNANAKSTATTASGSAKVASTATGPTHSVDGDITWDSLLPNTSLKKPSVTDSPPRRKAHHTPSDQPAASPESRLGPISTPRRKSKGIKQKPAAPKPNMLGLLLQTFKIITSFAALGLIALHVAGWDKIEYRSRNMPDAFAPTWDLLPNPAMDLFLSKWVPPTRPCPSGAICKGPSVVSCLSEDEILVPSKLAKLSPVEIPEKLKLLVPFGLLETKCSLNSRKLHREARKKAEAVRALKDLDDIVRRWVGKVECGEHLVDTTEEEVMLALDRRHDAGSKGGLFGDVGRKAVGMPVSAAKRALKATGKFGDEGAWFDEVWGAVLIKVAEAGMSSHMSRTGQYRQHQGQAAGGPAVVVPSEPNQEVPTAALLNLETALDERGAHHQMFVSTSPPITSISCTLKQAMIKRASTDWPYLLAVGVVTALGAWIHSRSKSRARDARVASRLCEDVLDALHAEARAHARDPTSHPVPGLSVAQVRDHFLRVRVGGGGKKLSLPFTPAKGVGAGAGAEGGGRREMFLEDGDETEEGFGCIVDAQGRARWEAPDATARDRVWNLTKTLVSRNANVRETVMELRSEPHRVWCWIGSLTLGPASKKPKVSNEDDHDDGDGFASESLKGPSGTKSSSRLSRGSPGGGGGLWASSVASSASSTPAGTTRYSMFDWTRRESQPNPDFTRVGFAARLSAPAQQKDPFVVEDDDISTHPPASIYPSL